MLPAIGDVGDEPGDELLRCDAFGGLRVVVGIVAGDAALLVDPRDPEAIAGAMEELLSDESRRSELVHKGKLRSGKFTWEKTARKTIDVYRIIAGR
jgi:glycosyltransferase involved in cell wall biosynthesis